jgi:hypothetical protein
MSNTVFWSWQSDLSPAITKDFIKQALSQAIANVGKELELEVADRLELDHDTKGEPGLVEIVSTIFKKIENCQIFVADITPVAKIQTGTTTKQIPNPNVMIELGYAIREVGSQRIITVANLALGGKPEDLPFDLRHRRGPITFYLENEKDKSIENIRKKLVKSLESALKMNLAAPREDQLIRNPMPALSVVTTEDSMRILKVKQEDTVDDVTSLDDIMIKTPLKTKAQQKEPVSPFEANKNSYLFGGRNPKPFREWTELELMGYNKRVQNYHDNYKTYLEDLKEYRLLQQRSVRVQLAIANQGTRPGTDVRAKVTFPQGILVYENDDMPEAPSPPTPPPFSPYGIDNIATVQHVPFVPFILKEPPRITDDKKSITLRTNKIQQGYQVPLNLFTIVMSTQSDIRSFEAEYQITADELPRKETGNLYFEVQQV